MKTFVVLCFICIVTLATAADFKKVALKCHNEYRKKHNSPPMRLTSALNQKAQAWANNLANADTMMHSQRLMDGPGENLYMTTMKGKPEDAAKAACDAWYDEINLYNFNNPGFSPGTGHFTQVVWKESKQLGVGIATSRNAVYVVANYSPGGNINTPDEFKKNVLRRN